MPVLEGQGLGVHRPLDARPRRLRAAGRRRPLGHAQPRSRSSSRRRHRRCGRSTARRAREGGGEPDGVIVTTLEDAVAEHPELVEPHLGSLVGDRDKFSAQNAARWQGGAFVYVPKGVRVEAPVVLSAIQATAGTAMLWRIADRRRAGGRADGRRAVPVRRPTTSTATSTRSSSCSSARARTSSTSASRTSRSGAGSSAASVPAWSATASLHWVGLGLGSGQRQAAHGDGPPGPRRRRPRHRRLRRPRRASTSTTTRPRSTPRPTRTPTSPSAASCATARPRSGAA